MSKTPRRPIGGRPKEISTTRTPSRSPSKRSAPSQATAEGPSSAPPRTHPRKKARTWPNNDLNTTLAQVEPIAPANPLSEPRPRLSQPYVEDAEDEERDHSDHRGDCWDGNRNETHGGQDGEGKGKEDRAEAHKVRRQSQHGLSFAEET